jgi:phosphatidylinositol glycan class H protein
MGQEHKGEASSSSGIYTYKHRGDSRVDIHEIFVKKSRTRVLLSYAGLIFLLAIVYQSLMGKVFFCCKSLPYIRRRLSE